MTAFRFRGKRVDNGEWIEGSLLCFNNWMSCKKCGSVNPIA